MDAAGCFRFISGPYTKRAGRLGANHESPLIPNYSAPAANRLLPAIRSAYAWGVCVCGSHDVESAAETRGLDVQMPPKFLDALRRPEKDPPTVAPALVDDVALEGVIAVEFDQIGRR